MAATSSIETGLANLALGGDGSDVTIVIGPGGPQLGAHRAVLAQRSAYFARVLGQQGGGVVQLPATEDANLVGLMLQFLYAGNYADGEYPALGPDPVAGLTDDEVAAALARPEELDLSEASQIPAKKVYTADEGAAGKGGDDDEDDEMDVDDEDAEEEGDDDEESDDDDVDPPLEDDDDPRQLRGDAAEAGLATDYPHSMFTSARLYGVAGRYGVPSLQLLARRRLYRSAVRHCGQPDFAAVVDEVFSAPRDGEAPAAAGDPASSPSSSYRPLRDMLCALAAWRYAVDDEDFRLRLRPVLARHPDLALGVLDTSMREGDLRGKGLVAGKLRKDAAQPPHAGIWDE